MNPFSNKKYEVRFFIRDGVVYAGHINREGKLVGIKKAECLHCAQKVGEVYKVELDADYKNDLVYERNTYLLTARKVERKNPLDSYVHVSDLVTDNGEKVDGGCWFYEPPSAKERKDAAEKVREEELEDRRIRKEEIAALRPHRRAMILLKKNRKMRRIILRMATRRRALPREDILPGYKPRARRYETLNEWEPSVRTMNQIVDAVLKWAVAWHSPKARLVRARRYRDSLLPGEERNRMNLVLSKLAHEVLNDEIVYT